MRAIVLFFIICLSTTSFAEVSIDDIKINTKLELKAPINMKLMCDLETRFPQYITKLRVIPQSYAKEESPLIPNSIVVDDLTFEKGTVSDIAPQYIVTMYLDTPKLANHLYTDGHKNCRLFYKKVKNYESIDSLPEFNLLKH
ncbi:MAG: hypothetical protein MK008_03165 [Bdellovibrionales bacterium]|nr:hypothetical protein [Bdellovibrionales bacterium]